MKALDILKRCRAARTDISRLQQRIDRWREMLDSLDSMDIRSRQAIQKKLAQLRAEYAASLKLSAETVAALETPMISAEEYIRNVNGG